LNSGGQSDGVAATLFRNANESDRCLDRHAAGDLDARLGEAVELGRIVGEQYHAPAAGNSF
jgi:hypothetical protein